MANSRQKSTVKETLKIYFSQFTKYLNQYQSSFWGEPIEPTAHGQLHSFAVRHLLDPHPTPAAKQHKEVFIVDAGRVSLRAKEMEAFISSDVVWKKNATLAEPDFDILVAKIAGVVESDSDIEKVKEITIEEKKAAENYLYQKYIADAMNARKIENEREIKKIKNDSEKILGEHGKKLSACHEQMRQLEDELKTDDNARKRTRLAVLKGQLKELSVDPVQSKIDAHHDQENAMARSYQKSVITDVRKHILQLELWRWLEREIQNVNGKIYQAYQSCVQAYEQGEEKAKQSTLSEVVTKILNFYPNKKLFKQYHDTDKAAVRAYLKRRVLAKQQIDWPFICPLTHFSKKLCNPLSVQTKGNNSPRPQNKDKRASGSQLFALTSATNAVTASPRLQTRQLELPPESRRSLKLDLTTVNLSVNQSATSHVVIPSPPSLASGRSHERFESDYDKTKQPPTFLTVCTRNPLRWLAAGCDGLAEGTMRLCAKHPISQWTLGWSLGGGLAIAAGGVNLGTDIISFLMRQGKNGAMKLCCCRGQKKEKQVEPLEPDATPHENAARRSISRSQSKSRYVAPEDRKTEHTHVAVIGALSAAPSKQERAPDDGVRLVRQPKKTHSKHPTHISTTFVFMPMNVPEVASPTAVALSPSQRRAP